MKTFNHLFERRIKMSDLFDLVREYADKCGTNCVIVPTEKRTGSRLQQGWLADANIYVRAHALSTDGSRLFAKVNSPSSFTDGIDDTIEVTAAWVYDLTENKLMWGKISVITPPFRTKNGEK
jgi:hypothetical protein